MGEVGGLCEIPVENGTGRQIPAPTAPLRRKAIALVQNGRPFRVCHLGKYYPPAAGGMESHVQTLARAQADLGVEVQVVCVNHSDRQGRDVTWRAFVPTPTVEENDGPVRVTRVGRWASLARLDVCPELPRLLGRLSRAGVDLFHLHTPNPTMLLAVAALAGRLPLVVTHHSDVIRQRFLGLAQRPVEHWVYGRAAGILTTSPLYAEGSPLLRSYAGRVQPLPLAIDRCPYDAPSPAALEHAARLRRELGWPLWLCVGRLVYYKGLHNAVDALAHVPGKLLVVGDGPLEADLHRRATERGVAGRIVWRARLAGAELIGAYHAATALWFPSNARSEGFGLVQVEAMASGCPAINTAIPASGVAWVSRHEETGLTVPLNDPTALAAAARRLLDEPGLRERLSVGARRRAADEFDHRQMARRSLDLYRGAGFQPAKGAASGQVDFEKQARLSYGD
jgi:rhamnosyl/mannosyltransferase